MLYRSAFTYPRFQDFSHLQQALSCLLEPALQAATQVPATAPAVQVRSTPERVELTVLAAGLNPSSIEVSLDQGVLSLSGERAPPPAAPGDNATMHVQERAIGRLNQRLRMPDDIDPQDIQARYAGGALHISIKRRTPEGPRRIVVQ